MKNRITAVLAAAAATLLLAGCMSPVAESSPPTASSSPAAKPDPSPSFAESPEEEDDKPGTLPFGDAVTYEDGVSISVSAPTSFTPSEYAAGVEQANQILFSFTITNDSDANLQPSAYSRLASGGAEASMIFDSENGAGSGPSTVLLPGQTVTWTEGYSVADPASLVLQVSPSFDYADAIFTNVKQ